MPPGIFGAIVGEVIKDGVAEVMKRAFDLLDPAARERLKKWILDAAAHAVTDEGWRRVELPAAARDHAPIYSEPVSDPPPPGTDPSSNAA